MRFIRLSTVLGLGALLLGMALAPVTLAAPGAQVPGWTVIQQPQWDPTAPWFSRTVVVQPSAAVIGSVPVAVPASIPVTVLAPSGTVGTFVEPTFVNTFQQVVVPTLATTVSGDVLQNGVQVMQVQPNQFVLVGPQYFCPLDNTGPCQVLAAQLAAVNPAFTLLTLTGPLGPGVYLAYDV
jgi:hypothetical protein